MVVKRSAVDGSEQNLLQLVAKRLFFSVPGNLVDYSLKDMMILRRLMVLYWKWGGNSTLAFWKNGYTIDTFHRLEKYFFFKQWVTNLKNSD